MMKSNITKTQDVTHTNARQARRALTLARETLRRLDDRALQQVGGGVRDSTRRCDPGTARCGI